MSSDEHPLDDDPWLSAMGEVARSERAHRRALPPDGPLRALEAAELAAITETLVAHRARTRSDEPPTPTDALDTAPPRSMPTTPARASSRARRRWGLYAAAGGVALAAAVALLVLRPATSTLPVYTVEAQGGVQAVRGAETESAVYTPGTRYVVVLRPAEPVAHPVHASLQLHGPDGPVPWAPRVAVAPEGGVLIEGTLSGPLALDPGVYTAEITVSDGESSRVLTHHFVVRAE